VPVRNFFSQSIESGNSHAFRLDVQKKAWSATATPQTALPISRLHQFQSFGFDTATCAVACAPSDEKSAPQVSERKLLARIFGDGIWVQTNFPVSTPAAEMKVSYELEQQTRQPATEAAPVRSTASETSTQPVKPASHSSTWIWIGCGLVLLVGAGAVLWLKRMRKDDVDAQ
jgi:hypothetical protein